MRSRVLEQAGVRNMRDLGWLPTPAGLTKPGVLYRAASLRDLARQEAHALHARVPLKVILDLRPPPVGPSNSEIETLGTARVHLPIFQPAPEIWKSDLHATLAAYRQMAEEAVTAAPTLLTVLADPSAWPLCVTCAAGKDRTGVVSALLLYCAGVKNLAIADDYMRSARVLRRDTDALGVACGRCSEPQLYEWRAEASRAAIEAVIETFNDRGLARIANACGATDTLRRYFLAGDRNQ